MRKLPEVSSRPIDPARYPPGIAFMDGQYLPVAEAKVSVLDYGFLHSDATYDVVHVWKGAFFRLDDHLDRFFRGLAELHMSIPYDKDEVRRILHDCVALSGLQNAYVEFIATRGTSPDFSRDPRDAVNRFIAFAIPFGSVANAEQLERGLHIAVTDVMRIPPGSVDPTVKNYHWLDLVKGLYQAYDRGAETAVLVDGNGNISEGPGFNIFAVKDGAVATPDVSVLLGVTRQTVFDICERLGVPCAAGPVPVTALEGAGEAFITSTAGGVMPVTRVNGKSVSTGAIGPLTERITALYWQMHAEDGHRDPVDYGEGRQG
jgi:branched-chain amino acid aminotransferase